jgi:hypothetical protein
MCNKQNISEFIQKLQKIAESPQNSLERAVVVEALDLQSDENTINFFENLLQHGCISGMVPSLVYYRDTEAFFDTHYEEIILLKTEYEEATGQPMKIPHQLKNHLAWFGFEETARRLWEAE